MKTLRRAALLCAACLLWTGAAALPAAAADSAAEDTQPAYEGLLYETADGAVTITGVTDDLPESVTIPSEIGGLPVAKIAERAFAFHETLTDIVIPESVTEIGEGAFKNCYVLKSAVLPDSLREIPPNMFAVCEKLESVNIPKSVERIGDSAFRSCELLTEFDIPAGLQEFGEDAFGGTAWMNARRAEGKFVVVNGVLLFGKDCKGNILIPEDVEIIGRGAFSYDPQLINVIVPANVKKICRYGFYLCEHMKSITILNPDCEIDDLDATICNTVARHKAGITDGCMRGYANSTAQQFAEKYEYAYEVMEPDDLLRGDCNGSWEVGIEDAQSVLIAATEALTGKEIPLTAPQIKACDIDGDGSVTVADAQFILLYSVNNSVAGVSTTWEKILSMNTRESQSGDEASAN